VERVIAALDIGGTKIAAGMVSEEGGILCRLESRTEPERGFEDAAKRMAAMLREACRRADVLISGIGIGCTGPVDPLTGIIGNVDFLPGWEGGNLADVFSKEFQVPVAVENDADAAALGEAGWGSGRGRRHFIYVTISTGIGGGIILEGKLYRGVGGAHPEIGHHVIDPAGPLCFCGAHGCWERLASGPAMAEWLESQLHPEERRLTPPDARVICEHAALGDELCRKAVEREAFYLGLGLANLVTLYTPDAIALGGGVMRSAHLFLEGARGVIRQNCGLVPFEKTEILLASLGPDTALAGAARAWFHRYGEETTGI
jgi:glucokinase